MGKMIMNGIPYGGGEVTPNPTGTPTDTLNTIGINDTIFDIASGGGSGSGVYIEEVLWEGTESTSAWVSPIELAINIEPYDFIVAQISNSMHVLSSRQIPTGTITGDISIGVGGYLSGNGVNNRAVWLNKDTNLLRIFTSTGTPIEVTKIVGIKVSGNYFTPQIYSLDEQEVGVWIDGKPLYQKSFTGTLTSTSTLFNITNLDIDELIKWEVMVNGSFDNNPFKAYLSTNVDSDKVNTTFYNGDMKIHTSSFWVGSGYFATIFYTKTTDTAGSGDWTPSGVPAHHYSTEEQVVGTWIDGSTVYEKIFDLGSDVTYSAGWHTLDIPKGNINRIFDGLFISDAGLSCDVGLACNDTTYLEILVYSGTSQVVGRYIKARYTKSTT